MLVERKNFTRAQGKTLYSSSKWLLSSIFQHVGIMVQGQYILHRVKGGDLLQSFCEGTVLLDGASITIKCHEIFHIPAGFSLLNHPKAIREVKEELKGIWHQLKVLNR